MSRQKKRRKGSQKRAGRRPDQKQVQRNVKDRLFRYLFEKDREALLELYNALHRNTRRW